MLTARRRDGPGVAEAQVRADIKQLDPLWDELFPAEQARIVQLLVEQVDVETGGLDIRLRTTGLAEVVADLRSLQPAVQKAA